MFNSKERKARKEMEMKMYIRQQKRSMEKIIKNLDKSRQEIIERGRRAQEEGMTDEFKMCQNSLKFTISQRFTASKMLLQLDTAARNRDISQMQNLFQGTMRILNKDMIKTSKNMNFAKLQQEYGMAMQMFEADLMKIDMFLEGSQEDFEEIANLNEDVTDEEVLKMFESDETQELQEGIDKALEGLQDKV
jgi:hypothetical protein